MIKLGVIGFGSRIGSIVKAVAAHDPEFHVTGVVDPDETNARARLPEADRDEAKFYPSLASLVKRGRPDALLIGTRCDLHARYAIAAAKTGRLSSSKNPLPHRSAKPAASSARGEMLKRKWW